MIVAALRAAVSSQVVHRWHHRQIPAADFIQMTPIRRYHREYAYDHVWIVVSSPQLHFEMNIYLSFER